MQTHDQQSRLVAPLPPKAAPTCPSGAFSCAGMMGGMEVNPYAPPAETGYDPPRPEVAALRAWLKDRALLLFFGCMPLLLYLAIGVPVILLLYRFGYLP
jgi:hypothetical protein